MNPASSFIRKFGALRFSPPEQAGRVTHDVRLDGLRGFAAVSVMMAHAFWFDAGASARAIIKPSKYFLNLEMSRAAVFLFFITSGYVIGLTNRHPFSWDLAKEYLRRRCLRIEPIYLVALVVGWLAHRNISRLDLLGNALFLQNPAWHIEPLAGDIPLWSLHNEAVYYLGFLLLWAYRPRVMPLLAAMTVFAVFDWFFGGPLSFLGGWSVGALFWLAGLLLSWRPIVRTSASAIPILSLVLLSYATAQFWPGVVLLRGLGFPYAGKSTLWLSDLLLLPVTLSLFCAVTNLNFPGRKLVAWIAVLIPVGMCVLLRTMGRLWENVPWTMSGVATIAAVSLLALRLDHWGEALFKLFRPLGKISYGLYLFHVPLAAFVSAAYPWTGGWANYAGGFLCWLAASLLVAWIFEARLQAYLLSFYKRRMASAGPKQA